MVYNTIKEHTLKKTYSQTLLTSWEDVYKKGQLTFWILLALKESPKHMAAIKEFIGQATNHSFEVDDKSMYRALRRYHAADMVTFKTAPGANGPDRKIYELTTTGQEVLGAFITRNIAEIFYKPEIRALIEKGMK